MVRKIGDVVVLDFTTHNPSSGAVSDADSTPSCEVFEDDNDTAILTPTVVKRASKTGDYRVSVDASAANGFEVGKSYNVVVSATVGGVAAKARVGSFTVDSMRTSDVSVTTTTPGINAAPSSFTLITGTVLSGTYLNARTADGIFHLIGDVGGVIECVYTFNIGKSAYPINYNALVDMYGSHDNISIYAWNYDNSTWEQIGTRLGDNNHTATWASYIMLQAHVGKGVDAGEVKIRYYGSGLGSAELGVDLVVISYAIYTRDLGFTGQAVAGSSNTVQLGSEASSVDDYYKPGLVVITGGTGVDQYGRISSYDGSSRTITIAGTFEVPPDATSLIQIHPWGSVRLSEVDPLSYDGLATGVWDALASSHGVTGSLGLALVNLLKIQKGRWKIDVGANTLTLYDENGIDALYVFDLKDSLGSPNHTAVYERVPA